MYTSLSYYNHFSLWINMQSHYHFNHYLILCFIIWCIYSFNKYSGACSGLWVYNHEWKYSYSHECIVYQENNRKINKQIYIINAGRDKHNEEKESGVRWCGTAGSGGGGAKFLDKASNVGYLATENWVKWEWASWS